MELRTYLEILWRRKWVITITAGATVVMVIIGTLMMTPVYKAQATIRVAMAAGGDISYTDYMYAERLINTYRELATSGPVLEELTKKLGGRVPAQIDVEILANTELMNIVVEDSDPMLASEGANALAEILVAQSRELYTSGAKPAYEILGDQLTQIEGELAQAQREYEETVLQFPDDSERIEVLKRSLDLKQETYATLLRQYESARATEAMRANALSLVEVATPPETPSRPSKVLNLALGCVVGVLGGVALAFVFEHLDTRLHTVEQIEEATSLITVGRIPYTRKGPRDIFLNRGSPQQAEAYRRLRTRLLSLVKDSSLGTVLITSAEPREGKSTILANLAVALAESGQRVMVVDADLRLPVQHNLFDLPNQAGLSSVLEGRIAAKEAEQRCGASGVSIITSGPLPSNPAELLGSAKMTSLLKEWSECFDIVLIDTPSLLAVPDAVVLAPQADGVLLVVARAQTDREAAQITCGQLREVKARLIGTVVNRMEPRSRRGYYRYYRHSGPFNSVALSKSSDRISAGKPMVGAGEGGEKRAGPEGILAAVVGRRLAAFFSGHKRVGWIVMAAVALVGVLISLPLLLSGRGMSAAVLPTETATVVLAPTATVPSTIPVLPTDTAVPIDRGSPVPTTEPSATPCSHPADWAAYEVQAGETLAELALVYGISLAEIMEGNCLTDSNLSIGQTVYLPPQPLTLTPTQRITTTATVTATTELSPTACLPPEGWTTLHVVEVGDSLYSLALTYGVTVEEIVAANCLESTFLSAGQQQLYLPSLPEGQSPPLTPPPALTTPSTNTPTPPVEANNTSLPAPVLVSPANGSEFESSVEIVLRWGPVEGLPADAYYAVSVSYFHLGQTWYDDVPWTRDTEWALSDHGYLLELSDNGEFRWSVQVVRQTGVDAEGRPTGEALSEPSQSWKLNWKRPSGQGGGAPEGTPAVPPP